MSNKHREVLSFDPNGAKGARLTLASQNGGEDIRNMDYYRGKDGVPNKATGDFTDQLMTTREDTHE